MESSEIITSLAIVSFAALIHASFQLSVSTLTMMSGHAIGKKTSHTKLVRLASSFIAGAVVMTTLLVATAAFTLSSLLGSATVLAWSICSGILLSLGVSVWLFYFRPGQRGTSLWLPRSIALFLGERSKRTKNSGEAFGLGLSSVVAEGLFILGPVLVSSMALIHLSNEWQFFGVILYSTLSILSLLTVGALIGGGHGLGSIQKWRETNKKFLQFAAGGGLIVLGLYVYIEEVVTVAVSTGVYPQ